MQNLRLYSKDYSIYVWNPSIKKMEISNFKFNLKANFEFDLSKYDSIFKYINKIYEFGQNPINKLLFYIPEDNFSVKQIPINHNPIEEYFFEDKNINSVLRMYDTVPRPYIDLLPNGEYFLMVIDSNLKICKKISSKEIRNNKLHGISKSYYKDGNLSYVGYFNLGFPDSTFSFFELGEYERKCYYFKLSGFISIEIKYKRNGELEYFQDTKNGFSFFTYRENLIENFYQINKYGQLHGNGYYYDENGRLKCKYKYSNGRLLEEKCID